MKIPTLDYILDFGKVGWRSRHLGVDENILSYNLDVVTYHQLASIEDHTMTRQSLPGRLGVHKFDGGVLAITRP